MRQRVMIAMALSCKPELIIADEPTTALDVTIQAQILELMQDLCRRLGVALVIITHNLGIVARYADRVTVMYAGRVVEEGTADDIYHRPSHPYTIGLLNSVPRLDRPRGAPLEPIPGNPPDILNRPAGCAFRPALRLRPAILRRSRAAADPGRARRRRGDAGASQRLLRTRPAGHRAPAHPNRGRSTRLT